MMQGTDLPAWAALLTAFFVVVGSGLTLVGSLGLLRLKTFYQRLHAPTLGTTLGTGAILIGSMIFFSALGTRLVLHEMLIAVFVTVTTPVTLILLVRATRQRGTDLPPPSPSEKHTEDAAIAHAETSPLRWPTIPMTRR